MNKTRKFLRRYIYYYYKTYFVQFCINRYCWWQGHEWYYDTEPVLVRFNYRKGSEMSKKPHMIRFCIKDCDCNVTQALVGKKYKKIRSYITYYPK